MPEWLRKEYGPFTGTVWVVVIVGGVGLGFLMRRYMNRQPGAAEESVTSPESVGLEPDFVGSGTEYNQGAIVADVLVALRQQQKDGDGGNSPGTNPGNVGGGGSGAGAGPSGQPVGPGASGQPVGPGAPPGTNVGPKPPPKTVANQVPAQPGQPSTLPKIKAPERGKSTGGLGNPRTSL